MITLKLNESESSLLVEALYELKRVKQAAMEALNSWPGHAARPFEPRDFALPQIDALIYEIEAKQDEE